MEKTLIPVMFAPYEDELLESWIARLAQANKMPLDHFQDTYLMDYFNKRNAASAVSSHHLDGLFWISRSIIGFPKADELLLFHTIVPLFRAIGEPISMMARKTQAVLYDCGEEGYDVGYVYKRPLRNVCPQCLNDAANKKMMPYLKVWHQVPGVKVCAVHKCPLLTADKDYNLKVLSDTATEETDHNDTAFAEMVYSMYLKTRSLADFKPARVGRIDGLIHEKTNKVFLYSSCACCGTRFLTTIYAVEKGRWCPVCDRGGNIIERQIKLIPGYSSVRKIRSLADTGAIRHFCGQTLSWKAGEILWDGRRCNCRTNA